MGRAPSRGCALDGGRCSKRTRRPQRRSNASRAHWRGAREVRGYRCACNKTEGSTRWLRRAGSGFVGFRQNERKSFARDCFSLCTGTRPSQPTGAPQNACVRCIASSPRKNPTSRRRRKSMGLRKVHALYAIQQPSHQPIRPLQPPTAPSVVSRRKDARGKKVTGDGPRAHVWNRPMAYGHTEARGPEPLNQGALKLTSRI